MADWNDPATWNLFTRRRQSKDFLPNVGASIDYLDGRLFANSLGIDLQHFKRTAQQLGAIPNFTPSTDVLVVGCGFGWLLEVFRDLGSNNYWGTDTSTLIHSLLTDPTLEIDSEIQARILSIDVQDPNAAQLFKAAGAGDNKGEWNWIVTEHLLETWPIADIPTLCADLDGLRNNQPGGVAHYVQMADTLLPEQVSASDNDNLLSMAEWVAVYPSHWWIDSVTGNMDGGQ